MVYARSCALFLPPPTLFLSLYLCMLEETHCIVGGLQGLGVFVGEWWQWLESSILISDGTCCLQYLCAILKTKVWNQDYGIWSPCFVCLLIFATTVIYGLEHAVWLLSAISCLCRNWVLCREDMLQWGVNSKQDENKARRILACECFSVWHLIDRNSL